MDQLSFFADELRPPEGLFLYPEFLDPKEERELLAAITRQAWEEVRMHGVVAKRRVKHYGLNYGYSNWRLTPTEPPPEFLYELMKRAAPLMGIPSEQIIEILVTEYPTGAGIGWHRDAPMFGDAVFGVSLGSSTVMKFRRKIGSNYEVYKADLPARGAYVISGQARRVWQHHIAPVKAPRWSITFRSLKS